MLQPRRRAHIARSQLIFINYFRDGILLIQILQIFCQIAAIVNDFIIMCQYNTGNQHVLASIDRLRLVAHPKQLPHRIWHFLPTFLTIRFTPHHPTHHIRLPSTNILLNLINMRILLITMIRPIRTDRGHAKKECHQPIFLFAILHFNNFFKLIY